MPDDTAETRALLAAAQRADRTRRAQPAAVATAAPVKQVATGKNSAPAKKPTRKRQEAAPVAPVKTTGSAATVIVFLRAQLGEPYVFGAAGPNRWDCSGLVQQAMAQVGVKLPHNADAIAARGRKVPRSQIRAGDVLHWPGHVAVAISTTQMIHASRAGVPVKVANIYGSPQVVRFLN